MKCTEIPIRKKPRKTGCNYVVACPMRGKDVPDTTCLTCPKCRIALADKVKCEHTDE